MTRKFWNWVRNEEPDSFGSDRTLYLDGEISDETWFGDEVTPKLFSDELHAGDGNITLWINSPGGDVFAAAQIYNMLMDYPHDVTVKIDALAASAASVIAMAGTKVCMSPVAMMMVHNPATIAIGDTEEMQKAIDMLNEVKESIMNAYEIKTGLNRTKISHLMDAESWFNAKKAVELGFADEVLFDKGKEENSEEKEEEKEEEEEGIDIEAKPEITFDDFMKMQFQVGEIIACEEVKKSRKLLCSQVRIGSEVKQIVSGIKAHYSAEEMVGKKVMVLVNLKPAKLAGVLSEGMLLCAEDADGNLALMTPEKPMPAGAEIC